MNKSRVLTLSYIIEDGKFEVLNETAGEFKWWTYVTDTEMSTTVRAVEDEETFEINWARTVERVIETWNCDDEDEEFGLSYHVNMFIELLKKYTEKCIYNGFSIVNWSVEYDVNVSVIVNME